MELPHHIQQRLERRWFARHTQDRKILTAACQRPDDITGLNSESAAIADTRETLRAER